MKTSIKRILQPLRTLRQACADQIFDRQTIHFMKRFFEQEHHAVGSDEIGFVIEPWPPFTALPNYVLALALSFVKRKKKVRIIWDDTPFGPGSNTERRLQRRINSLLSQLPPSVISLRLSEFAPEKNCFLSESEIKILAQLNTFRKFISETPPIEAGLFEESVLKSMKVTAGRIQALYQKHKFNYLVVTGGIYRTSGLFVRLGKKHGVRVATLDGGSTVLLISTDGVAAYLDDIPKAFSVLRPCEHWVIEEAQKEFLRRREGRDTFNYQRFAAEGKESWSGVLIPLNQSFDTSSLGRHHVFKSQTDWMLETTAWLLENTAEDIVVRRHPVERREGMRSHDDYKLLLEEHFGTQDRLRYVDSNALLNTYDLLDNARVVLPHVSTVGVEAAALGKPVVSQSASYYADLGFVWCAKTRAEYFGLLSRAVNGDLVVSEQQRKDAWLCYYLSQCCNFFPTPFLPAKIKEIVMEDPELVLTTKSLTTVYEAIENDKPLALAVHEANKYRQQKNSDAVCR